MDEAIRAELDGFERVWQRVSGETVCALMQRPESDETDRLKVFMQGEANDAALYRLLARRAPSMSKTLLLLASEEARHLRLLQLEYFLLAGDTFVPAKSTASADGVLSALRGRYLGEASGAKAYRDAARSVSGQLSALYTELADEELRHAEALRTLIAAVLK